MLSVRKENRGLSPPVVDDALESSRPGRVLFRAVRGARTRLRFYGPENVQFAVCNSSLNKLLPAEAWDIRYHPK